MIARGQTCRERLARSKQSASAISVSKSGCYYFGDIRSEVTNGYHSLKALLETAKIVPAVNQVEMHPHQAQPELTELCKQHGIMLTAYSPTGYSQVASDPTVAELASKYSVAPAQISLAWHVARGHSAVPKSTNSERQKGNLLVGASISLHIYGSNKSFGVDSNCLNCPRRKWLYSAHCTRTCIIVHTRVYRNGMERRS